MTVENFFFGRTSPPPTRVFERQAYVEVHKHQNIE